ncbi:hypothetical protein COV24_03780 [candidate division WWE3 bacterium CG10_big_fil_rev_8_21_14_0_10_32_10]|uniref:Uncharacterized protein n=1 Tax=candidate division WWE3 bacterium CG10_big_fil_rev_8_21_14_0_10_32_10 TaxID=1975090 RepID=A0A2H0R9Q5_UNCKA|nr:MAG: hypothetical protein COV24_03780 [candidate division WWE3 bacterium CG10_big_fil_rev_8_21_14_0_10_32_10]
MRVCPNCSSKIYNPKAYFCYSCGAKIYTDKDIESLNKEEIDTLIDQQENISSLGRLNNNKAESGEGVLKSKKSSDLSNDNLSKRWNYFVAGVNVISILFLLASVGVFFRFTSNENDNPHMPLVSVNNVEIEKSLLNDLTSEVLKSKFYEIIPQDVILYSESSDLKTLFDNILSEKDVAYLEKSYDMSLSDLLIFMKPDFSFVRKNKDTWAVITRTGGVDFFERTYASYQENKGDTPLIYTEKIGDYLVFSKDAEFIKDMDDTLNELNLSLASNAVFNSKINSVKGEPYFFAYSPSKDYLDNEFTKDLERFNLLDLYNDIDRSDFSAVAVVKESKGYFMYTIE